jgi:hypothetical protein
MAKRYIEEAYCKMIGCPFTPSDAGGGTAGGAAPPPAAPPPPAPPPAAPAPKRPRTGGAAALLAGMTGPGEAIGGGVSSSGTSAGGVGGNTAIRCICGAAVERGSMVQCDAPQCHVWQHADCVAAAAAAAAAAGPGPKRHFCERCRVARADPFWEVFDANVFQTMRVAATGRSVQVGPQLVPVSGRCVGRGEGGGAARGGRAGG